MRTAGGGAYRKVHTSVGNCRYTAPAITCPLQSTLPAGTMESKQAATSGLEAHSAQVKRDLQKLSWPGNEWVVPRTAPCEGEADASHVYDVVIVGGGQCGLAVAYGLMREKVTNVVCLDENPAGHEGPWVTYARMVTLRTPKHLTALDYGMPSLTFQAFKKPGRTPLFFLPLPDPHLRQAYYEARFGTAAWEALDKIPKELWMDYLIWYRTVLNLPVINDIKVTRIEPLDPSDASGGFRIETRCFGAERRLFARKVVLATGIQGGGEWHVPDFVKSSVPRHLYAHTSEAIDFDALRGKRIAILGGGASSFDNAQFALGRGAGEVHVFVRRPQLPKVNPIRFMEFVGFLKHFSDLDDASKYAGIDFFLQFNQPPTNDTFTRAARHPNFTLHTDAPWQTLTPTEDGKQVRILTPQGDAGLFDFLIVSTGLLTDARLRPELSAFADQIATWADRFKPPASQQCNELIDQHPYLGSSFEFQERCPGAAPFLGSIFAYNYSALASLGLSASALSGVKYALPKLINGITRQLFLEDSPAILSNYFAYDAEEFVGLQALPCHMNGASNGSKAATAATTATGSTMASAAAVSSTQMQA